MTKHLVKIDECFGFNSIHNQSISNVKDALERYSKNFNNAIKLKRGIPIFLDTNVLLNFYGMSSSEREKLNDFFKRKSKDIIITNQVEKEFIRNRISVIEDYFSSLENIKSVIESDLIKGLKNIFNAVLQNKILKNDFTNYWNHINNLYGSLNTDLLEEKDFKSTLFKLIDRKIKADENLGIKDDILETYQNFMVTDPLDNNEITFLQSEFKKLNLEYNSSKPNIRWKSAFPGCGEKKEESRAIGDFIIYHEILKFMKEKSTDAIFLTNDITKEDWIQKNGKPFIHYIEKTYLNSSKTLYVFDTKRLLDNISFENIYEKEEVKESSKTFSVVEDMPEYPGGESSMLEYLIRNLKYPKSAIEQRIEGKVYITFVVEKDGSINGVSILRGIGGGCDEEAVRVVKNMPKWNPGKQRGHPVKVQFNMPITFKLN